MSFDLSTPERMARFLTTFGHTDPQVVSTLLGHFPITRAEAERRVREARAYHASVEAELDAAIAAQHKAALASEHDLDRSMFDKPIHQRRDHQ